MASNLLGLALSKNLSLISQDKVLDKKNGVVLPIEGVLPQVLSLLQPIPVDERSIVANPGSRATTVTQTVVENVEIKKEVEVVLGVDGKRIDFTLATSDGPIPPVNGYLVEVYLSGTDGKLTRVYREDVVDAISDETLSEGFSNYLTLILD